MKVKGKVFVVTGAGSGIGRELTLQLVQQGARVAMVDWNDQAMKETAQMVGAASVSHHHLSVSDKTAVDSLPEDVLALHGEVDGLINNAGVIQPFVDITAVDDQVIERVFNVNWYGTVYLTRAFLPHLLKRPEAHIVNVSSMAGFIPFPGQAFYSASKAAVKVFTEALYAELKGTKVGVTCVLPGAVRTNILSSAAPSGSASEAPQESPAVQEAFPADKAAGLIIEGIEKKHFRVLIGKDARMLDKLYRLSARRTIDKVVKNMGHMKH